MDIRYYKTNVYFLAFVAFVFAILIFFLLRHYRSEKFQQNIAIAVITAIIIVCVVYFFPMKLRKSVEPFDEVSN